MEQLLLPLLLMAVVAIPLVMGTRKQKRAAAEQQQLQAGLTEGDRVMTTSGLYGTVADTSNETTIDIEIAPGVVTTWLRQAVREKVNPVVDEDESDSTELTGEHESITDSDTSTVEVAEDKKDDADKQGAQVAPPLEHGKK
ncbi:preprotein translocase subunit YajC [Amycolatopsis nigrescens]|uniref:preprotein translocase subunit YajC n=1 Tax=Amycolatopsis nigrescens TaxID=381445 RepID=UPI00035EC6B6|nr:preprotein translocase subunit YajC [Amycolatopsis nigrescens]